MVGLTTPQHERVSGRNAATVYTDDALVYERLPYDHETVNHSVSQIQQPHPGREVAPEPWRQEKNAKSSVLLKGKRCAPGVCSMPR